MGSRDYIVTTFGDEAGSIGFRWVLPLAPTKVLPCVGASIADCR